MKPNRETDGARRAAGPGRPLARPWVWLGRATAIGLGLAALLPPLLFSVELFDPILDPAARHWEVLSLLLLLGGVVVSVRWLRRRDGADAWEGAAGFPALALALCAVHAFFDVDLRDLWILVVGVEIPFAVVFLYLLHAGLVGAWVRPGSLRRRAASGVVTAVALLLWWNLDTVGTRAYWLRHRATYARAVPVIRRQDPLPHGGELEGVPYRVDDPPERIAFPWPGGIIDNWTGVVWDPSGSAPPENAFGGQLIHAVHLGGPWYLCSFT